MSTKDFMTNSLVKLSIDKENLFVIKNIDDDGDLAFNKVTDPWEKDEWLFKDFIQESIHPIVSIFKRCFVF